VNIVAEEGPVLGHRIHEISQAVRSKHQMTKEFGRALNRALTLAVNAGELGATNPLGESGVKPLTFILPGRQQVDVRALGPRSLNQVPPAALFELMGRIADAQMISGTELTLATLGALGLDARVTDSHRRLREIVEGLGPFT